MLVDDSKLLVPAMEEIIEDRRPSVTSKVEHIEKTPWMPSDEPHLKGLTHSGVRVRMVERETYDDYDMVTSSVPVLQHQYFNTKAKKWDGDIAAHEIRPDAYKASERDGIKVPGLGDRFGSCIAAYLKVLAKERQDIPIQFLADKVYPRVLNAFIAAEIHTVNELAAIDDGGLDRLRNIVKAARLKGMDSKVSEFRNRARAKLAELGIKEDKPSAKKAA